MEQTSRSKVIFNTCNFSHPNYIFETENKSAETTHKVNGARQVLLKGDLEQDSIKNIEIIRELAF